MLSPGRVASPQRQMKSVPRATAAMKSEPLSPPTYSAMASAVGMATTPGCMMASSCTSSKSSEWAMVALSCAAFGTGNLSPYLKTRALRGPAPLQHQVPQFGDRGFA